MKRAFLLVVVLFVLVLTGCGGKGSSSTTKSSTPSGSTASTSTSTSSTTSTTSASTSTTADAVALDCGDVTLASNAGFVSTIQAQGIDCATAKDVANSVGRAGAVQSFSSNGYSCVTSSAGDDIDRVFQCKNGTKTITFDAQTTGQ